MTELTLYVKQFEADFLLVSVYVDDLLITGSNEVLVDKFKLDMKKKFEMNDLGKMSYFLGMEVVQSARGIFIHQRKYALEILERFDMQSCKPVHVPLSLGAKFMKEDGEPKVDCSMFRRLVGSLLYLCATRPDIVFYISLISRYMYSPSEKHVRAAKRIPRYIKGTSYFGVKLSYLGSRIVIGMVLVMIAEALLVCVSQLALVLRLGVLISKVVWLNQQPRQSI